MNIAEIASQAKNIGDVIFGANTIAANFVEALARFTWLLTPYKWIEGFAASALAADHVLNHSFLSSALAPTTTVVVK